MRVTRVLQNVVPDCDLALVHDDDLKFVKEFVSYFRIVALSLTPSRVAARIAAAARHTKSTHQNPSAQNSPGSVWSVFSRIDDSIGPVFISFQLHRAFTWQQKWVRI